MTPDSSQASPASTPRHPIAVVAERTGLSQDLLRVWERRYGAVEPTRSAGGQRLYSDNDVERLRLLDAAVAAGRRVGRIARLPTRELAQLVEEDRTAERRRAASEPVAPPPAPGAAVASAVVDGALAHVRAFDARGLEEMLRRSASVTGVPAFLEQVVAPLLQCIGDEWHAGRLTIAQEHLASAVIEALVVDAMRAMAVTDAAPSVLLATTAGSRHVIAVALAGAVAAAEGWRVLFLGGGLPASEIADAAIAGRVHVVAVSVVHAEDPGHLLGELRALRARLPAGVPLLAGGRAVLELSRELARSGIEVGETLDALRAMLRQLPAVPEGHVAD